MIVIAASVVIFIAIIIAVIIAIIVATIVATIIAVVVVAVAVTFITTTMIKGPSLSLPAGTSDSSNGEWYHSSSTS